jgi:Spy/CpxP family protein refolding chaperone
MVVVLAIGGGALASPLRAQQPDSSAAPPAMQNRYRERLGQLVKTQLGLTDAQYQKVVAVNAKYEGQRFTLLQQERELRITIRAEVLRGDQADQKRIARLIDDMFKVQQQRLDILASEQKDLSAFLTPLQRAKYLGIQEQVRKRLQKMRDEGGGPGMGGGNGQMRRQRPAQQPPPAQPPAR